MACLSCFATSAQELPSQISLNNDWTFYKGDDWTAVENNFDDSGWEQVSLPHSYNAEDVLDDTLGYYRGAVWYRKTLFIPEAYFGKKVSIYFEGVSTQCDIFLNNRYVGQHLGGYTSFVFDVEGLLEFGEENTLAIRVSNAEHFWLTTPPVHGDFSIFGGIYRDVYLTVKNKIFFDHNYYASTGIFWHTLNAKSGNFRIDGRVANHTPSNETVLIRHQLLDTNEKVKASLEQKIEVKTGLPGKFKVTGQISDPQLWSPDSPTLYQLVSEIWNLKQDSLLDQVIQKVGFRTISVDQESGFRLNGIPLKIEGIARHQDYHLLGYGVPDSLHVKDLELIKETGSNFTRLSHYPHDPVVYHSCDELGLMVWSEIPAVNWVPYGSPFLENSLEAHKEMVYQNYNHPSVVIWGYRNEIWQPHSEAERD